MNCVPAKRGEKINGKHLIKVTLELQMLSSSLSMIFIYIAQIPASVPSTLVKLTKSQGIHLITIRASHNHTDKVPTN